MQLWGSLWKHTLESTPVGGELIIHSLHFKCVVWTSQCTTTLRRPKEQLSPVVGLCSLVYTSVTAADKIELQGRAKVDL
jgi:hypothetical protein